MFVRKAYSFPQSKAHENRGLRGADNVKDKHTSIIYPQMEATVLSIHQIFLRRTGNNVYRQLTVCCVLYTFQCALVTTL